MLCAVAQIGHTGLGGTVVTAKHLIAAFQAMPDNAYATVRTGRCELMNSALKAVKGESFPLRDYLKKFIVVIAA